MCRQILLKCTVVVKVTCSFFRIIAEFQYFNPFLTSGLAHPNCLDESISSYIVFGKCFHFYYFLQRNSCK